MLLFINKMILKIKSEYRKRVFAKNIRDCAELPKIYGEVHVINRNITCGKGVSIYPQVQFFGDGEIQIGDNVSIGNGTMIYSSKDGGVVIGDNTMIAGQSYVIDTDHGMEMGELIRLQKNTSEKIHIGSDVWIAAGCKILKGSVIKDGAVIGAMSLVKSEVDEYGIAFGIPAKVKANRRKIGE